MKTLSLIIITRNEAHNLEPCIASVPCADEVVVVDAQSTDGTPELAKRLHAQVYDLPWRGFGPAKQAALERATGRWVLSLDADERLDEDLARAVSETVRDASSPYGGYRLARISNFLGRWMKHSGWYPDLVLRLGLRQHMTFTPAVVHEQAEIAGAVGQLGGHLLHYTDPDFRHYLEKLVRYADLSAQQLYAGDRRARIRDVTVRPWYQFVRTYLLQSGFRDGMPGLLLAGGSAFHVFAKYARLWDLQRRGRACSS